MTLSCAGYEISQVVFGSFKLDGGAMFGSVPKNIWTRSIAADEENCIALVSRSLLLRGHGRTALIDVGLGDKWDEKRTAFFKIINRPRALLGFQDREITDVVLTHLHFDHGGGITKLGPDGQPTLTYPDATIHIQAGNLENARAPNLREQASYLKENVEPLSAAKINAINGTVEVLPGVFTHQVDGHSKGQQWIEITDAKSTIMFATDLIPTAHHLPLPFTMGYDICALTVMQEREEFLARALSKDAIVVFQHDGVTAAARLKQGKKYVEIAEVIDF